MVHQETKFCSAKKILKTGWLHAEKCTNAPELVHQSDYKECKCEVCMILLYLSNLHIL